MIQSRNDYRPLLLSNESQFWIGNPSVELTNGKMYFSNEQTSLVVCLSIPNNQQPIEFCEFLNDYIEDVKEIKVLMIESPQTYAVLMQFIKSSSIFKIIVESAKAFVDAKHHTQFNQIEEDLCILRFVQKINIDSDREQSIFYQKGKQKVQPKRIHPKRNTNYDSDQCAICFEHLQQKNPSNSPRKIARAQKNKTDAIISVLCGHYFHLRCLWQWNQPVCPLCRYEQQPPEISFCDLCSNSEILWLCLICGQKFCEELEDINKLSHNKEHFLQTQHALHMNINTKLVFDHQSLNYVHRILINEFDGKLVQHQEGKQSFGIKEYDQKLNQYMEEQNQIFTQSLASQRIYFESLLTKLKEQGHIQQGKLDSEIHSQENILDQKIEESIKLQNILSQEEANLKDMKTLFLETNSKKLAIDKSNDSLIEQIQRQDSLLQQGYQIDIDKIKEIKAKILSAQLDIKDLEQNLKFKKKIQKDGLSQQDVQGSQIILLGTKSTKKRK